MTEISGIGQKIYDLRIEHDIQQGELAKAIGLHQSVLNRIEKGTRPARDCEISALASYFQVSSDYLLGINITPAVSPTISTPSTTSSSPAASSSLEAIPSPAMNIDNIYGTVSASFGCTSHTSESLTPKESEIIHKYRRLDPRGKDALLTTLEQELKYV